MARIGFGIATSHGPMLSVPWENWTERVAADRANPRHFYQGKVYTFDEMVALHKPRKLSALLTPEIFEERHGRCQKAIRELGDIFVESKPDVAVVVGNDQMEIFTSDFVPAFAVFWDSTSKAFRARPSFSRHCLPELRAPSWTGPLPSTLNTQHFPAWVVISFRRSSRTTSMCPS